MRLASLNDGSRDGRLVVVSADARRALPADDVDHLIEALRDWPRHAPQLAALADRLEREPGAGMPFDPAQALAPLPSAPQWLDGSAFASHGRLMIQALKLTADPADGQPLMYQGMSDHFLAPCADVPLPSEEDGIDFEGEFAVVLDDTPMGIAPRAALGHVRLITIVNDWSLRRLAPRELRTGFGFVQAKPACSAAPLAVTPDELGAAWQGGRVGLALSVQWNGTAFGRPRGDEMSFDFGELIAHAARTRRLCAGTLIGSGTVSNADAATVGSACIAERRALEMIEHGEARTAFMRFGDRVRIEAHDSRGSSVFGAIDQRVVRAPEA